MGEETSTDRCASAWGDKPKHEAVVPVGRLDEEPILEANKRGAACARPIDGRNTSAAIVNKVPRMCMNLLSSRTPNMSVANRLSM